MTLSAQDRKARNDQKKRIMEKYKQNPIDFTEMIHTLKEAEAEDLIEEGEEAQFKYLLENAGLDWLEDSLS